MVTTEGRLYCVGYATDLSHWRALLLGASMGTLKYDVGCASWNVYLREKDQPLVKVVFLTRREKQAPGLLFSREAGPAV